MFKRLTTLVIVTIVLFIAFSTSLDGALADVDTTGNSFPSVQVSEQNTIRLNIGPGDPILDPAYYESFVINQIFRGLFKVRGDGSLVGDLAGGYRINKDGLEYVFNESAEITQI